MKNINLVFIFTLFYLGTVAAGCDPCDGFECPAGQECQKNVIRCIKAPCPEKPGCVPIKAILPHPVDPCWNVKCEKDEVCKVRQVWCIKAPCPPIAVCEKKLCKYGDPALIEYTGQPITCGKKGDLGCPNPYKCKLSLAGDHQKICCPPKDTTECPLVKCVPCDSGYYKFDKNGCQTCVCDVDPCTKITCKDDKICKVQDVQCIRAPCPPIATCVFNCPQVRCSNPCTHFKQDKNGCMTCQCADDPCETHQCKEGQTCKVLESFPPKPICVDCPKKNCLEHCQFYKYGEDGCRTCECDNPCIYAKCSRGFKCIAEQPLCKKAPCPVIARCVPDPHQ